MGRGGQAGGVLPQRRRPARRSSAPPGTRRTRRATGGACRTASRSSSAATAGKVDKLARVVIADMHGRQRGGRARAWWTGTRRPSTRRTAKRPTPAGQPEAGRLQPEAGLRRVGRRGHPPAGRVPRVRPPRLGLSNGWTPEAQAVTVPWTSTATASSDICPRAGPTGWCCSRTAATPSPKSVCRGFAGGARAAVWADYDGERQARPVPGHPRPAPDCSPTLGKRHSSATTRRRLPQGSVRTT